jgi:Kelch motif
MSRTLLGAAAAVALLVVGGSLYLIPRVARPSPTASANASPSLPVVVPPRPTPSATTPTAPGFPRASGVWIATGSMGNRGGGDTTVRLLDGKVLVLGGRTAELYDPATGTWSATGSMAKPHACFPATLLHDGKVLVGVVDDPEADNVSAGAEVYDPAHGTWTATGKMVIRSDCSLTATLLLDGKVLLTGREGSQLYDPNDGTWAATGSMVAPPYPFLPRRFGAAVLLPDGKVLVAGGGTDNQRFDTAELYDPNTGSWSATASMHTKRDVIAATLLADGTVLVVGYPSYSPPTSAEVYDPATGTWTPTGDMVRPDGRYLSATLLSDGTVLASDSQSGQAELYDPSTRSWTITATMLRPHGRVPATVLLDGTVLVAGGDDCWQGACVATGSAELYVPAGVSPPAGLPAAPDPTPTPIPTPSPTPLPPQAGPVPPGASSWTVTVINKSSRPATLFVAEETEAGLLGRLVGSVTPNVVPPDTTMEVTFLLPAKGVTRWLIFVNPGPNDGALLAETDVPLAGEIYVTVGGQPAWRSS